MATARGETWRTSSATEIERFRDDVARRLTKQTANFALKAIRSALRRAKVHGLTDANQAERVATLPKDFDSARRAFTEAELRHLLTVADREWQGMIMTSLYVGGLRLGDVAKLDWARVNLESGTIELTPRKTRRHGKTVSVPIADPLRRFLETLPSADDPKAPLFPRAFALYDKSYANGDLSKEFRRLLEKARLAKPRRYRVTGKGSSVKHEQSELSFHSLRHSATSMLKNAGVSDAVTMDIAGHSSPAVSRRYTKIDASTKAAALAKLPDLLAPSKDGGAE